MFFSNFLELYFRNRLRPRFFRNAPMNPFAQSIDRDATHLLPDRRGCRSMMSGMIIP
jgi:hypothetical protein